MYGPFKLRDQETQLEWILFHEVLVTSKVYVRTVCPVRYEWVKDLLPRLHKIDVYELSSMAREEVTEEEMAKWRTKEDLEREIGEQNGMFFPHVSVISKLWAEGHHSLQEVQTPPWL